VGYGQMCPRYAAAIDLFGKRWTGLLLRILLHKPKRFGEFRSQVPDLSDRMLSERLTELEAAGIIQRIIHTEKPIIIEYELTPKGRALEPVVRALEAWANAWEQAQPVPNQGRSVGLNSSSVPD